MTYITYCATLCHCFLPESSFPSSRTVWCHCCHDGVIDFMSCVIGDMGAIVVSWVTYNVRHGEVGMTYITYCAILCHCFTPESSFPKKTMAQCGTVCMSSPPHHDVHAMSPMTPRWHPCHLWHRHGVNDTIMATMTPHCPGAGKGRFWCKTMAQYGTVCNICHPHLTMTYMLCHPWHHDGTHVTYDTYMESMTLSWQ